MLCTGHMATRERFSARLWINSHHDLEFYPNAITLSPDVAAAETVAGRDPSRPYSVKDSFARLDLAPEGLELLFEAEWIAVRPASQDHRSNHPDDRKAAQNRQPEPVVAAQDWLASRPGSGVCHCCRPGPGDRVNHHGGYCTLPPCGPPADGVSAIHARGQAA
jgi:hypothetical protein